MAEQGEVLAHKPLGLAAAVAGLRAELTAAMTAGAREKVRFELGPVQMEFGLEIEAERGGEGGIKFWVVTLGGKASSTSGATHKVTLELTPKDEQGGPLGLISDTEPAGLTPQDTGGGSMSDRE